MCRDNWKWYLKRDEKEYGPLSHRELLLLAGLGKVHPKDELWAIGFPGWVSAHFIPGLLNPPLASSWRLFGLSLLPLTLGRLEASWLRVKSSIKFFRRDIPSLVPMISCAVACLGVIAVAIGVRTSAHSSAVDGPELAIAVKPVRPPQNNNVAHVRAEAASIIPVSYSPMPQKLQSAKEEPRAELVEEEEETKDEAVPLPTRKTIVKPALRSLDTKAGARSVQRRLRELGYLTDDADGAWGARSRLALKQFQTSAKISSNQGWSRRAERALFSASAPRASGAFPNPIVETLFRHD